MKNLKSEKKSEQTRLEFTRAPTPNGKKPEQTRLEFTRVPTPNKANKKSDVLATDKMPDLTHSVKHRTAFDISNSIKSSNRTLLEISKLLKPNEKLSKS